jgi:hypothetical protein
MEATLPERNPEIIGGSGCTDRHNKPAEEIRLGPMRQPKLLPQRIFLGRDLFGPGILSINSLPLWPRDHRLERAFLLFTPR